MIPRQYTGGPADQQEQPPGDPQPSDRVSRLAALPRALLWFGIATALVAGVVLYFLYERGVVPLFGGRG